MYTYDPSTRTWRAEHRPVVYPLATRRARRLRGWRKLVAAVAYRLLPTRRAVDVIRSVAGGVREW